MTPRGRIRTRRPRGSALLLVAFCAILPLGAIGTMDAGFESSVAVPHHRTRSQGTPEAVGRSVIHSLGQASESRLTLPRTRLAVATTSGARSVGPAPMGRACSSPVPRRPALTATHEPSAPRGPPSSC